MKNRVPRYMFVHDSLKSKIENAEYGIGDFLPPEPELERLYNVSRITVRKAVEILGIHGFVEIRQGRGTKVLDYKVTQKLQYVTSFSETLRDQGFDVSHKVTATAMVRVCSQLAEELHLTADDLAIRLERIAYANGEPIATMVNHLPAGTVPGFERRSREIKSLYLFLEREYNITIDSATEFISAVVANEKDAKDLSVEIGEPLLVVKRISYYGASPVETSDLRIIARKYKYSVHTKGRPPRGARW